MQNISKLIKLFSLKPHPEGGYYRETYRSRGKIRERALPKAFKGSRNFSTCIYYLLPEGQVSRLHRLRSDEVWHFYLGGPMTLLDLTPQGKMKEIVLGQDITTGQKIQYVVPAGHWFAATPKKGSKFSLVGCTLAPGFEFKDFELAHPRKISTLFPRLQKKLSPFFP